MTGSRILVLAPHPDDEVVGCAAAISRALTRGAAVFVLYLTTGLPASELAWPWHRFVHVHARRIDRRRAEALAVAARLGVEPAGFTDWPARRLRLHLAEARALLVQQLAARRVDTVWVPAFEGAHQDHDAANLLASTIADRVQVLEFAEYNASLPGRVRAHEFPSRTGGELTLVLTPDEVATKRALIAAYRSERANLGQVGAAASARGEARDEDRGEAQTHKECFRPLPTHDYLRPPHPGVLFYQRFQWIPFAHPRVDFTPPVHVQASFAAFLSQMTALSQRRGICGPLDPLTAAWPWCPPRPLAAPVRKKG